MNRKLVAGFVVGFNLASPAAYSEDATRLPLETAATTTTLAPAKPQTIASAGAEVTFDDLILICKNRENAFSRIKYSSTATTELIGRTSETEAAGSQPVFKEVKTEFVGDGTRFRYDYFYKERATGLDAWSTTDQTWSFNGNETRSIIHGPAVGAVSSGNEKGRTEVNKLWVCLCPIGLSTSYTFSSYFEKVKKVGKTIPNIGVRESGGKILLFVTLASFEVAFDPAYNYFPVYQRKFLPKNNNVTQLELWVSELVKTDLDWAPAKVTIEHSDHLQGNEWPKFSRTHISISNLIVNPPEITDAFFNLEFPPEIHVVQKETRQVIQQGIRRNTLIEPTADSEKQRWPTSQLLGASACGLFILTGGLMAVNRWRK